MSSKHLVSYILQRISQAQDANVIDAGVCELASHEDEVITAYKALCNIKALMTLKARKYTVKKYREQGEDAPSAGEVDARYARYYLQGIVDATKDVNGIAPYFKGVSNEYWSTGLFPKSGSIPDEAEELFQWLCNLALLDPKLDWNSPVKQLAKRLAHSLKNVESTGPTKMSVILVWGAVVMKHDPDYHNLPSGPWPLAPFPTLTAVSLDFKCERVTDLLWVVQVQGSTVKAPVDGKKMMHNQTKIEKMLQEATDDDLGLDDFE